jgi:transcription initiation factor TFIIIB Brf1 subunit/transcription initiation factor TFIIB
MAAAAHDPRFASKLGIPQSVAQDFNAADTGTQLLKQSMTSKALRGRGPTGAPRV